MDAVIKNDKNLKFSLSPDDIHKIRAEESLRVQLRKELNIADKKSAVWEFLNSAFGIWLFSSVAVGLITFLYTEWSASRDSAESIKKEIAVIDAETAFRLQDFGIQLAKAKNNADFVAAYENFTMEGQPVAIAEPTDMSSKYRQMEIRKLLFSLGGLVDEKDKPQIKSALKNITELRNAYIRPDVAIKD